MVRVVLLIVGVRDRRPSDKKSTHDCTQCSAGTANPIHHIPPRVRWAASYRPLARKGACMALDFMRMTGDVLGLDAQLGALKTKTWKPRFRILESRTLGLRWCSGDFADLC